MINVTFVLFAGSHLGHISFSRLESLHVCWPKNSTTRYDEWLSNWVFATSSGKSWNFQFKDMIAAYGSSIVLFVSQY